MRFGASPTDGISEYLKCHITSQRLGITVVGYIGEGSSAQLTNNWSSPFESDNVGSAQGLQTTGNVMQTQTGVTSISKLNSKMVWNGIQTPTFQLSLYFQAITDAKREVQDAIMHLQQMASPELNELMPFGRVPQPCVMDIGRRIKIQDVVIQDIGYELDAPRTKDGYFTHNIVTLQCCSEYMYNAFEIPEIFSGIPKP